MVGVGKSTLANFFVHYLEKQKDPYFAPFPIGNE